MVDGGGEIGAGDKSNPVNLGGGFGAVGDNYVIGGKGHAGVTIIPESNSNSKGYVLKDTLAANEMGNVGPMGTIDDGLKIMDPKRRRVEDVISDGSSPEINQLDTTMVDSNVNNSQNQKNEEMAGAAVQARLEL